MEFVFVGLGIVLLVLGLVGIVAPGLPDAPLVYAGMLFMGGGFGFDRLSILTWVLLGLLALLMWGAEFASTALGAKIAKASRLASVLAIVGAILGFLAGSLPGLLIGPFLGAVLGELINGRNLRQSAKSGLAALAGMLSGAFMKVLIVFVMILTFTIGMAIG